MSDVISVCAWCPANDRHTVLRMPPLNAGEKLILHISQDAEGYAAIYSDAMLRPLVISHGICDLCRGEHFAEAPSSATQRHCDAGKGPDAAPSRRPL